MKQVDQSALHDAYAADYDEQVAACDCHVAELLFGLMYEYVSPGERLLDVGTGSGLSAELFARVGLEAHGMDFSPAMLEICAAKGFAAGLKRHDLQQSPWPYGDEEFDHVVCCGVLHFIAELDTIFAEVARVLRGAGVYAFTTRAPESGEMFDDRYERQAAGAFEVFSHAPACVDALLNDHALIRRKMQRVYVGEDVFVLWVAGKQGRKG